MTEQEVSQITVQSSRFGELVVPADCVVNFPNGLIGFPSARNFILVDHKPPFSWLQCVEDPQLAFVVVDGFEFGEQYQVKPPLGDPNCDFQENDEYGLLIIVTARPDPADTTANLKAPLFINLKNKTGVQIILDDPRFSVRYPLWSRPE